MISSNTVSVTFELVMKRRVTRDLSSTDASSVLTGEDERSLAFSIVAVAAITHHITN